MRQSKKSIIKFERVESFEVIKLSDRQRINELCPDGFVYDIEIEDNHNYLANDILVHNCGAFPKPSKGTILIKKLFSKHPMILMSGTPTPESFSQIYHQFWVSNKSPFSEPTFYKWANTFVDIKQKKINGFFKNDYSHAKKELIDKYISKYLVSFTQEQAQFKGQINETILECMMKESTYKLISRLENDLVIEGKEEVILADTVVKLLSKKHQLFSGTIKFESERSMIIDNSKGVFIKEKFSGQKIAIFYKYKAEWDLLKSVFGDHLTNEIDEFNDTDKNIALQVLSGREGTNLSKAQSLVYINIDYSATSYWQSRDRLTTIDRPQSDVYYVFAKGGIEHIIFKCVKKKRNFTTAYYEKFSKQNNIAL